MTNYTPENFIAFARKEQEILWRYHLRKRNPKTRRFKTLSKVELNALLLLGIAHPSRLIQFFQISQDAFFYLINQPIYHQFEIPKKKGGQRIIMAPNKHLKRIQQHLNFYLQAYYYTLKPKEVHGFVVNPNCKKNYCNILENAKLHCNKKFVLNIDLKDFFPSIKGKQILALFQSPIFDFDEKIALMLAMICTYKGALPIGAPTSPVISNFICLQLDAALSEAAERFGLTYSRYADDLTFSCNETINNEMISELRSIITGQGFEINEGKFRITHKQAKQSVTGITVNKKPNVDRKLLKKVRAMLHDMTKNGLELATQKHFELNTATETELRARFVNRLGGYINFIGQIRGKTDRNYTMFKSGFDMYFSEGV